MDEWFFRMKTVPQQGRGCALACVATVAGVSFSTAKKAAFPRDWRDREGYGFKSFEMDEDRVRATLRRLGWTSRPVNDFRRLVSPSIVFLLLESGSVHAMVWDPFFREFRDPGAGYFHRDEIITGWRRGGFRSVTVTGRLVGAGPAPMAPEADDLPLKPGASVDPVTGQDDADLANGFNDGLCGCVSCLASRAHARCARTYVRGHQKRQMNGYEWGW